MDCEVCGGPITRYGGEVEADFLRRNTCREACRLERRNNLQRARSARNKQMDVRKASRLAHAWGDIQEFISGYHPLT